MIDQEISSRTQGMVQRRKAKVTTAPSLATNTIGVTEAFGDEMFLPFVSNMISAKVGDFVWIEWMYGATNAFVSCFAEVDEKDRSVAGNQSVTGNQTVGGNQTVNGNETVNGNATFNGVLDVVPRRCDATLPTSGNGAGWYRAIEYDAYDTYAALGYSGEIVTIKITYTSADSCQHLIKLFMSYNKIVFMGEESSGTTNIVEKIRYCVNGSKGYVDIQYNTTTSHQVNVSFDVASRTYAQERWKAYGLVKTADSPVSPETVVTTYSFAANTETTGSFTGGSGVTISEADIKRSGNVVYVHFYAQKSWSANTEHTVGSLSGVPLPSKNIRWLAGGGSAAYYATTPVYAILDTSGVLKIYPSAAIGAVNITVSYIV